MKKRLVICLCMVMLGLAGCGKESSETEVVLQDDMTTDEAIKYAQQLFAENVGDSEDMDELLDNMFDDAVEDFMGDGASEVDEEEELSAEEVIAIAEEGFKAIKDKNPEEMIKYTNVELLYYARRTEKADDEKLVEEITDIVSEADEDYNSLGVVGHYATMENIELYDPKLISTEEIEELNAMVFGSDFSILREIQDYQYKAEKAYKLQMSYDGMEEEQKDYVLVVYANGQWELDVCIAFMKDTYRMIMPR